MLRTQNVSEQNQKHFFGLGHQILCPQQMLRARANGEKGEIFVSTTMCPQQCVLVCQGFDARGSERGTTQLCKANFGESKSLIAVGTSIKHKGSKTQRVLSVYRLT